MPRHTGTAAATRTRTTILLIEDSPSDTRLITESLRDAPHERFSILTASTLAQGLRKLKRDTIDVILLDLSLPDSDGIATFHAVRQLKPALPIVVLTMTDDDVLGLQMIHEGAQDYLPKTVLTQETCTAALTRAIRYAIERKRLEEQTQALNERLEIANKELYALNRELRYGVQERSEELGVVNEELRIANEELRTEVDHRATAERMAEARADRTTILNEIIHTINEASDLPTLYERTLIRIIEQLGFERGLIATANADGQFDVQHAHNYPPAFVDELDHLDVNSNPYTRTLYKQQELVIMDDAQPDSVSVRHGLHGAVVLVPFLSEGSVVGHLALHTTVSRSFSSEDRAMLQTIGLEFGTAMARLRVKESLKESEAELQQYADHLHDLVEERTTQLKDAERLAAIGQTATMIGHDLRNPLQALQFALELEQAYLNAMETNAKADPRVAKAAQLFSSMEQQIQYMDKIVSDLQDYARPLTPEPETVHITPFVTETLGLLTIPESISVSVNIPGSLTARVDPHLMQRVLSNLMMNAVQAMPEGGELTIDAEAEDHTVMLCIHDTGEGIPENMRETLFSPLTTGKAKGTGLGLAVVKRIVEAHNGTITFTSEEGKGTMFTVTLPHTEAA